MSSFSNQAKTGIIVGIVFVVALLGYAGFSVVSQSDFGAADTQMAPTGYQEGSAADRAISNDGVSASQQAENNSTDITVEDRKVIRNGSLELIVDDVKRSAQDIRNVTSQAGGFVTDSRITDRQDADGGTVRGAITIKVPADDFQATIDNLKELAVRVASERTSARDVTEQLTDLEARLRNARRTEQQYLNILDQAESIDDILQVQERVSEIRERIERLEANQQQLRDQVQMATINIDLTAEEDVQVAGITWKPLNEIKAGFNSMVDGLVSFLNMIISVVFALPVIALWLFFVLAILAGVWKIGWWLKRLFGS
jgi:hypothetical protein